MGLPIAFEYIPSWVGYLIMVSGLVVAALIFSPEISKFMKSRFRIKHMSREDIKSKKQGGAIRMERVARVIIKNSHFCGLGGVKINESEEFIGDDISFSARNEEDEIGIDIEAQRSTLKNPVTSGFKKGIRVRSEESEITNPNVDRNQSKDSGKKSYQVRWPEGVPRSIDENEPDTNN